MCGIVGLYEYGAGPVGEASDAIRIACDRMACRGPDDRGTWFSADRRVAFGHRRLAIIDLSEQGAQPMHDQDTGSVIVFNGEIYNYRELRSALAQRGHRFRSASDTEVLLKLYAEKGEAMVHDLRGMFAFAIWDASRRGLFLARDHFGIKPLYYADDGRSIRVASETKALVAMGGVDTTPDPAGHVGFFLWGHVPEPYTVHRGVKSLPAGSTMWVTDRGAGEIREYASVRALLRDAEHADEPVRDRQTAREELRELMLDSVRAHLVSDVDVGIFLSAGLDSTTIAALAAEAGGRLRTVTLGFEEFRGTELDETPLAELVARQVGADHTTVWVTRSDFANERDRLFDRMDQPSTDGVNSYFVARAAAAAGLKVVLSGLGGDELFGGYPSFRELPRVVAALGAIPFTASLGRAVRVLSGPILRHVTSPKYAGVLEYGGDYAGAYLLRRGMFMPWELSRVLDRDLVSDGLAELRTLERLRRTVEGLTLDRFKVSALETSWYMRCQLLRDTDWTSMTHSVEVRTPLLDWALWKGVARLVTSQPWMNKSAMARTVGLPPTVLNRAKTGFGIHVREWLTHEGNARQRGLRGWAHQVYERTVRA
jgi:asparagine synthase (glutamine-hydrolysing)